MGGARLRRAERALFATTVVLVCLSTAATADGSAQQGLTGRSLLQTPCPIVDIGTSTFPGSQLATSLQFDITAGTAAGTAGLQLTRVSVYLPSTGATVAVYTRNTSAFASSGTWRLATSLIGLPLGPGLQSITLLQTGSANPALPSGQTVRPPHSGPTFPPGENGTSAGHLVSHITLLSCNVRKRGGKRIRGKRAFLSPHGTIRC